MTTGGFTSKQLIEEEQILRLPSLTNSDAVEIGEIATTLGNKRRVPIAIQVRIGDWIVFHASLQGSKPENDWWINRKVSVVKLKQHSTMYERVSAEERGVDWHKENNVQDETHAIHGGALPLITDEGFKGILIISGLPQVEDHLFAVEVLTEFLAQKGEELPMSQVWVTGEVLIDLIPDGSDRTPIVGGGPANTAKALSKLGINTQFIDGVSTDDYGQMTKNELISAGVKLDYVKYSDKPTSLAIVSLSDSGSASYEFVIGNTATFDFTSDWLPNPQSELPALLQIGTLATVIEPGASVLFEWAQSVAKVAPIVFDPNIRPAVISDRKQYVMQVERWVSISSAVKVSDEDIRWLYPSLEIDQVVNNWLAKGPSLIVVTYGDKGLAGYRVGEKVSVDSVKVLVADTVGAGDTVGAILVEAIVKDGLDTLSGVRLEMMLKRAAKAAAITVSRSGANPPTLKEIE